jgi:uncharacterized protein (DUF302 family)
MKKLLLALLLVLSTSVYANEIYKKEINLPIQEYFPRLKQAITANHMNVLYELNLIDKFKKSGYAKRFGKEFNKNKLKEVKTLLLCNGHVGNQVSNIDPDMMALCPIRLTLISQGKSTKVVFIKSSHVATSKKVKALLATLDQILINTIDLTIDPYMQDAQAHAYDDQFSGN